MSPRKAQPTLAARPTPKRVRKTPTRTFTLPDPEWEALHALADKHDTNASVLIRMCVLDLLKANNMLPESSIMLPTLKLGRPRKLA